MLMQPPTAQAVRPASLADLLSDFVWFAGRLRVIIAVSAGVAWGLSAGPQPRDILVMLGQSRSSGAWALFVAATVWLWVNTWFWSGFALASREPPGGAGNPSRRRQRWRLQMRLWLPRLLAFVPFVGIGVALLGAASAIPGGMNSMMGMNESGARDLQLAAGLIFLLGLILLWLLSALRRVRPSGSRVGVHLRQNLARRPAASWWRRIGIAGAVLVAASLAAAASGMIAFGLAPVAAAAIVQPAPTILFAAAGIICIGTILTWIGASSKIPVLGILLVLAFVLAELRDADRIADNHDIRMLDRPLRPRPDIGMALQQFAAANASAYPAPEKLPVVLVATSGGGIAAAFWTATILSDLADTVPRFSNQLFAISAVSGGGLGSLVTVGLLNEGRLPPGCRSLRMCAQHALGADFLAPTLGSLLYPDLMQRFVPVPVFEDRAVALEKAWETRWRSVAADDRLGSSFLDLWPANHPWPALMLNGTSIRTGGRTITSNVQLTGGDMALSMEAEDLLSMAGAEIRASTAADNSARFPLFGPVGVLRPHGTANTALPPATDLVVDGGYFEDFGATTLLEMLDVLQEAAQRDKIPIRFVVIQIIGAPPVEMPSMRSAAAPRGFFGPLVTLLRTRDARGAAATEALARRVATLGGVYVPLRLGISPTGQSAPLSWSLSAIAQHVIDAQWTTGCRDSLARDMNLTMHSETVPGMSYTQMMSIAPCEAAK
jgi:hypothetical protein